MLKEGILQIYPQQTYFLQKTTFSLQTIVITEGGPERPQAQQFIRYLKRVRSRVVLILIALQKYFK